jgi:hypothetical protein
MEDYWMSLRLDSFARKPAAIICFNYVDLKDFVFHVAVTRRVKDAFAG